MRKIYGYLMNVEHIQFQQKIGSSVTRVAKLFYVGLSKLANVHVNAKSPLYMHFYGPLVYSKLPLKFLK
jgi:hypothetical protein